MRYLALILSALIVTLITTEVSAASAFTCKIATGYGTAIGRGTTQLAAKQAAREECGSKIIDQYFAQRGRIPAGEAEDDLVLSCVNLECQQ